MLVLSIRSAITSIMYWTYCFLLESPLGFAIIDVEEQNANRRRRIMSQVFFTNMSTSPRFNLLRKVEVLIENAGLDTVIEKNKMTAVKVHFGEHGNLAYVRPNYIRTVVDAIKKLEGRPFVTDANTLYTGSRSNAVDHIRTAFLNGFVYDTVGAPVIIADGLRGSDEVKVPIDGEYVKEAKIGAAIALANNVLSVSHFKGHEQTGFGGALKNLGMGSASRAGKMEQHSDSKPVVVKKRCVRCRMCEKYCPVNAIRVDEYAVIDYDVCIGCGQCIAMCAYGAMNAGEGTSAETLSYKIAEYTKAVLKDKKSFHLSFIIDISPNCDCWHVNEPPIAPDIGIAASLDPVALDKACIDLVLDRTDYDPFEKAHPGISWKPQLEHAEKIGIGSTSYELIEVANP